MSSAITEQELVAACRETLRQWPRARAAVLFGSRARGTQRPDSDWDVAVVLEGDEPREPDIAEMPVELDRLDVWALSKGDLRRRARVLGTLVYAICRDGRVLAGDWRQPDPAQMEQENAVNPGDWVHRMKMAWQRLHASIRSIGEMAEAEKWDHCAQHCGALLEATADAAGLLVKAAMERRGVRADRGHDIARLAAEFGAQRPAENPLAERMASLNGDSRRHHVATDRFRPPEVPDVQTSVRRLVGTLDFWAAEVEAGNDAMAARLPALAGFAVGPAKTWHDLVRAPARPKPDGNDTERHAGEAALDGRAALAGAITSFRDRMRRVIDSPS